MGLVSDTTGLSLATFPGPGSPVRTTGSPDPRVLAFGQLPPKARLTRFPEPYLILGYNTNLPTSLTYIRLALEAFHLGDLLRIRVRHRLNVNHVTLLSCWLLKQIRVRGFAKCSVCHWEDIARSSLLQRLKTWTVAAEHSVSTTICSSVTRSG